MKSESHDLFNRVVLASTLSDVAGEALGKTRITAVTDSSSQLLRDRSPVSTQ